MKGLPGRRVVQWVARALDPAEREVVLGDLAESGESWNHALWEVFGLVVRREAALWLTPRPWLILIALVIPLGLLISVLSRITSGATSVYLWMYANNSDWDLIRSAGFWYVLREASLWFFVQCLALACGAWTVGYVIGVVSGKFVRSSAFVFLLVLLAGEFIFAPRYLALFWQLRNELFHFPALPTHSDPVSANFFYALIFPLIVQIALVAVPALAGVVAAPRLRAFTPLFRTCVLFVAITSIALLVIREPGFGFLFYRQPLLWLNEPLRLLQFVAYWPIPYFLAIGTRARLRSRTT